MRFSDELIVPYAADGFPGRFVTAGHAACPTVERQTPAVIGIELHTTPVVAERAATV